MKKISEWCDRRTQEPNSLFKSGCFFLFIGFCLIYMKGGEGAPGGVFLVAWGIMDILFHAFRVYRKEYL